MDISADQVRTAVISLIAFILSVAVHEFGHAWMANRLGDPLPAQQGRLTLSPLAHIDPIGTILLPLFAVFAPGGFPLLAWGKPVQTNPKAYRGISPRVGHMLVSLMGPLMNLLLAVVISILLVVLARVVKLPPALAEAAIRYFLVLNIMLMFFNLLPLPPLDGALGAGWPAAREPAVDTARVAALRHAGVLRAAAHGRAPHRDAPRLRGRRCVGRRGDEAHGWMMPEAGNVPYRVALPEFEGPLDLLLHLCKTHEIEIVNIPISFITEKYLEYLEVMQTMPVDLAADYLVMAATLAYLKSRELVPSPEPLETASDEEEEVLDPREELIRRLLEYQKYKDAAEKLGGRPIEGRNVFLRGAEIEGGGGLAPLAEHSVWKLIESFGKLLEKAGNKSLTHDVIIDRVSISERINQLVDRIEAGGGSFRFDACLDLSLAEPELRSQLVVTLLAVLELARLKVVRVLQSPDGETLFISQVSGAALADARRAEVTSAEEVAPAVAAPPSDTSLTEEAPTGEATASPPDEIPAPREDKNEQT